MEGKKREKVHCAPVYKFQKVARLTRNGYLNFLRDYKKRFCGISPQDMVRYGARQWNKLSPDEMKIFKTMTEPVTIIKGPTGKLEILSNGESASKSKREKRSPYARERESMKERLSSRSKKSHVRKRNSNSLGSAVAYIHFLRKFQKKNPALEGKDLLKQATRMWCRLQDHKRQHFELPLW
ncbi:hypothetical protein KR084_001341 [Drosophila pseudotakahashii]|nr:hypothetical protein KR084_001341 [Drosophila pseudotakahashii]